MLAITLDGCPAPNPDGLFRQLTDLRVFNMQVIDDATARGISRELVSTVRCNTEEAARRVVVPGVLLAGIAAVTAGIFAGVAVARRRH